MVSIKDAKNTYWSKDDLCKKSRMKRMSDPYLLTSIKIKWAETLNCSWKTQSKHLKTCMPLSEKDSSHSGKDDNNWSQGIQKLLLAK